MAVKNKIIVLMGEKQARTGKPVSISDVAKAAGVSRQVMSNIVAGKTDSIKNSVLDALCDFFDCEVGDILYKERPKKEPESEQPEPA